MRYKLISIGDSLTQGFRSLAVNREFQEVSFPYQIYKANKNLFCEYNMPFIEEPGFPINIEFLLYTLENIEYTKVKPKKLNKLVYKNFKSNKKINFNNNLGIVGFTAAQIYSSNYKNSSNGFEKFLIKTENLSAFNLLSDVINLLVDAISCKFKKTFTSLSFSRIVYTVLCGEKNRGKLTEVDIAMKISTKDNVTSLISYWAGSNDVIGALLSGEGKFISNSKEVLKYINLTLDRLLENENSIIAVADIPNVELVPFIDKDTLKPIFPMYDKLSSETWNKITDFILEINDGIYKIVDEKKKHYKDRVVLVPINKFFKDICESGYIVQLKNKIEYKLTGDYINIDDDGKLKKGGFFSLDGVHPTATGYSIVANEFIKAFNSVGAELNYVDINEVSSGDVILNTPPKFINEFVDVNSELNGFIKRLGLYEYISTFVLAQFNLNNNL